MRLTSTFLLIITLLANYTPLQAANRPNFIIIMADDMGYGDSSVYNGWIETPALERMAREGLKFTDFHSSGVVCSPTRAGLMTGRYQERAGIPGVVNADPKTHDYHRGLQHSEITFAELLQQAGYKTAMFGKWHLGYSSMYNPTHHGFTEFCGFVSGNIDYLSHYDRMNTYDWWDGVNQIKEEGYLTHLLTKHAVRFIDDHKDQPFCLYVPHGAVHTPIQAPDSPAERGPDFTKSGTHNRSQGENVKLMMQALDDNIGAILDAVTNAGIAENTFVLFFSDNGGAAHMRCDPLRGKKGTVWEGGHRVPALAWWPGHIMPDTTTDQLCISLDVMPTLLKLTGLTVPNGLKLDGIDLSSLILDRQPLGTRQLFWKGQAMRDGPWKLVARAVGVKSGSMLFNLTNDISEKNDLSSAHPTRVKNMLAALQAWKTDVAKGATTQPNLP
jgi:arylsulfatase A